MPIKKWMRSIIPTAHNSDGPFFRQCKIELNPQIHGLTRCIQQDVPSVRLILTDHVLERKRSFYPRLYIPVQGNYDRPTWYGELKIEEKVVHIAQRNQKRGVKEKSVNREKHEKDKMTEDSNTHGSEES